MAKKSWKKKTEDCKTAHEKVEELALVLKEGVENFSYTPEQMKAVFEMKAIMPTYSFRNLIVAKAQLPESMFLASFKRWKELGRNVKKDEKSLRIFAPRFKKDEETEESQLKGFISVPVFDYSQTEGEPLPIDKLFISLEGECDEARAIIEMATIIAEKNNCNVSFGNTGASKGYYSLTNHRIVVSEYASINQQAKTLVHELVHSRVHAFGAIRENATSSEKEMVAEGVAFIVCSYFGLDTSDYSFQYVYGWSKDKSEDFLNYGKQICDVARDLIKEFQILQGLVDEEETLAA